MIYNFLFYNAYKLAKKSGNFNNTPVLGGGIFVAIVFILNLFSLLFVLEGLQITYFEYNREYSLYVGFSFLTLFLMYYGVDKRYIKIVDSFEKKNIPKSSSFQLFVVFCYYLITFILLLISGLFKNKDWIFK